MAEEKFIVDGLAGAQKLSGTIRISGSKNAGLPVIAASLMCAGPVHYSNVPAIEDMSRMFELLSDLGVSVTQANGEATIDATTLATNVLTREVSERFRASIILTGPLLARCGEVQFPHPGGCVIGNRPIDIFLNGFEALGATVTEVDGMYTVSAQQLVGCDYFMPISSVTATESLVLAALGADGITRIHNASFEPEVVALCEFVIQYGAHIEGVGTPELIIHGHDGLLQSETMECVITPDRLEAGSYLILGALAGSEVTVTNCRPDHLGALLELFRQIGITTEVGESSVTVFGYTQKPQQSYVIKTHEFPGFPTDLQAPAGVLMTQVPGETLIFETIFEGRLHYLHDLERMGARVDHWDSHRATVHGGTPLKGRTLKSPDIRAGLAFIIAAIIADGTSEIHNVYLIDRGYERVEEKLANIGVAISRVSA